MDTFVWILSSPQYEISQKYVQWQPSLYMRTDGQTRWSQQAILVTYVYGHKDESQVAATMYVYTVFLVSFPLAHSVHFQHQLRIEKDTVWFVHDGTSV
jgi:hypothetical protein